MTWEYLHVNTEKPIAPDQINDLGAQGWELVSVVFAAYGEFGWPHHYYFKRPLSDDTEDSDD